MTPRSLPRPLLLQSVIWIALPIALVLTAAIIAGTFAYQQVVTSLLLDRDRQLASLAAARMSEALQGYTLLLETWIQTSGLHGQLVQSEPMALSVPEDLLEIFCGGMAITDRSGAVRAVAPPDTGAFRRDLSGENYFLEVRQARRAFVSDVVPSADGQGEMVVLVVPVFDAGHRLIGTAAAGIHLQQAPFGEFIQRLNVSDDEFAYLVDGHGRAIYHPEPELLAADLADRPFVQRVIAGESGGMLWTDPAGTRLVQGYAPVEQANWGLVVREPWETVVAPVRAYGTSLALAAVVVLVLAGVLLFWGTRRIAEPIAQLAGQARSLGQEAPPAPIEPTGIREIDDLSLAFSTMAEQVASFRAGLRRYLGAVTRTQEEERQRIGRDLHDETTQNLIAIQRQMELYRMLDSDQEKQAALERMRISLDEAIRGLREISRDLRPFILEDLGLIPSLRSLLQASADRAGHQVNWDLQVWGEARPLPDELELALYRITQEAIANVHKHSSAQEIAVELRFEPDSVRLTVRDDGQGFELPPALSGFPQRGSYGLMGIQERAWAAGGNLTIDTAPGEGTSVTVLIPATPVTSPPR